MSPEPTVSERGEEKIGAQQENTDAEGDSEAPAAKRRRPPPSIDFTGYDHSMELHQPGAHPSASQRPDTDQTSKTTSLVDFAHQAELAAVAARIDSQQISGDSEIDRRRLERREELRREAEAMRAALRAKEREIDELV